MKKYIALLLGLALSFSLHTVAEEPSESPDSPDEVNQEYPERHGGRWSGNTNSPGATYDDENAEAPLVDEGGADERPLVLFRNLDELQDAILNGKGDPLLELDRERNAKEKERQKQADEDVPNSKQEQGFSILEIICNSLFQPAPAAG